MACRERDMPHRKNFYSTDPDPALLDRLSANLSVIELSHGDVPQTNCRQADARRRRAAPHQTPKPLIQLTNVIETSCLRGSDGGLFPISPTANAGAAFRIFCRRTQTCSNRCRYPWQDEIYDIRARMHMTWSSRHRLRTPERRK